MFSYLKNLTNIGGYEYDDTTLINWRTYPSDERMCVVSVLLMIFSANLIDIDFEMLFVCSLILFFAVIARHINVVHTL
jgi:hypothetical protein